MTTIMRGGLEFKIHGSMLAVTAYPAHAVYYDAGKFSVSKSSGGSPIQISMNNDGSFRSAVLVTRDAKSKKWVEMRYTDPNEVDYLVGVDLPAIYRELREKDKQTKIETEIRQRRAEIAALEALKGEQS